MSYCGNEISLNDVRIVCGKPEKKAIVELIETVKNKNIEECLKKINEFYKNDYDMLYIVEDIIEELDNFIFNEKKYESSYGDALAEFIKIYDSMKKSSVNKKILFEIGIMNFLNNNCDKNISREIISRTKIEQKEILENKNDVPILNMKSKFDENENKQFKKIRMNNAFVDANKELLKENQKRWEDLKKYAFDKEIGAKVCVLLDGTPAVANNNYVVLTYAYPALADKVNEEFSDFEKIINNLFEVNLKIVAVDNEEWKNYKTEYITKLNNGEKYQTIEDVYAIKNTNKSDILNKEELNNDEKNENEQKIYELFDSNIIEIK